EGTDKLLQDTNPGRNSEVREFTEKYFLPEVRKRLPEVGDMMAALWARNFSVEEMDKMIAFFRTDAGQRLIALQPKLFRDGMAIGQKWGEMVARDLLRKYEPQLKQQGLKSPQI